MKTPCAFVVLALAALPAAAEIYRCSDGGRVTYQEIPCVTAAGELTAIPTSFPPPNAAERDRLFEREAALYRRLEARRERELKEAMLRDAREERALERERLARQAEQQQAQAPLLVVVRQRPSRRWPGYGNWPSR